MFFKICLTFLCFLFYSVVGWTLEMLYCMFVDTKKNKKLTISNRGFLNGPLCPIYGFAATAMALTLSQLQDNIPLLFIVGILVCDAVEYLTSYVMEKIFNARWWNYEKEILNINGRICLKHSIMWGFLSVVFIKFIHSKVVLLLMSLFNETQLEILAGITLFLFIYDVMVTTVATINVCSLQSKLLKVKRAFSDFSPNEALRRTDIPNYVSDFRSLLKTYSKDRRQSRIRHLFNDYPEILLNMSEEISEMQSVPHEFKTELTFLQMDLDTFVKGNKEEMH